MTLATKSQFNIRKYSLLPYTEKFLDEVVGELDGSLQVLDNDWLAEAIRRVYEEGVPINWAQVGAYSVMRWGTQKGLSANALISSFKQEFNRRLREFEEDNSNTWREQPLEAYEDYVLSLLTKYLNGYYKPGQQVPTIATAIKALICWVKARNPELIV